MIDAVVKDIIAKKNNNITSLFPNKHLILIMMSSNAGLPIHPGENALQHILEHAGHLQLEQR